MIDKLLIEVSAINKKYEIINQKTGACFNIFDIAGIVSDERVVCKLLCELLNPSGRHYQGDAFFRLFINEVLRLNFTEEDYKTANVSREYVIDGNRRIDLFVETVNYKVPIEVKIDAGDQDKQCFDYYSKAQNANLYYLTRYGSLPSEESAGGLTSITENGEIIGYQGVTPISFRKDIIGWLDCCLALPETIKIAPIREILLQFKDALQKLTGQMIGGEKMEVINIITSSIESLNSALEIERALPEVKTGIMLNLFSELKRLFENGKRVVYDYDEETIRQYYFSRKHLAPYISVEIGKLPYNLIATLCIEIYGSLYYSFAFTKLDKEGEFCEYMDIEQIKKDYPIVYNSFVNAVFDVVGSGKNSANTIFWDYLLDDQGRQFDFKNFTPSCADLVSKCTEKAKTIYDALDKYISEISNKIEPL